MNKSNHPYHMVTNSPWPIMTSMSIFSNFSSMIILFNFKNFYPSMLSMFLLIMCMYMWWRDIIRESTFQGMHTKKVKKGLRLGMIMFIISELFFFLSIFWTFFHFSIMPSIHIGLKWPPKGIIMFNPYDIPLLNTLILLSSGFFLTWSHHSLLNSNFNQSILSLILTIILGIYFSCLQIYEYYNSPFTMNDSSFGSIFFMGTGFHGLHVIIGSIFLIIMMFRMNYNHFSTYSHLGFECAIWYWHFVDVIWLFLYISFYWWLNN
uniref:Cytochrome c oxidase subunit 3 n=1 Tax=Cerceris bucculata TaxID=2818497 RepID=A0A8B0JUF1_9HYME|nr:cytochrome c oxidase subunit III [Cerceris bucculata]QTV22600.1 cytochrome c oxidase subunit III [Cerceris bucculata]